MNQGKAVIFCAPSGAGKTTIVRHLISHIRSLRFSVSATTRQPRESEVHGKDYFFLSEADFRARLAEGELYEWQEVYQGMLYGTLKSEVERIWAEGHHVIFDVDVIGGINLKQALGERALAVFVSVDGIEVLRERLQKRGTETAASLEKRLSKSMEEMSKAEAFDYVLINRNLEIALKEAEQVVTDFLK